MFALCYGICETMNGNWASLDMKELGASTTHGVARAHGVLGLRHAGPRRASPRCSAGSRRGARTTCCPFVLAAAFVAIVAAARRRAGARHRSPSALAGLGCSALLPLTISFGQEELIVMSASVAGGVIACYQVGYGIAAFGAGPLQDAGVDLC